MKSTQHKIDLLAIYTSGVFQDDADPSISRAALEDARRTGRLLSTAEAATFLCLRPCTLEKWRTTGGGPTYVQLGGAVRYRLTALEDFVTVNAKSSTAEA